MSDTMFIEENYELVDIDAIETIEDNREVYDLEVEEDHTYVLANDIISHNSRAKAGKSMLKEMTHFCGKYRVPFIFTNHTYKDVASAPNPMYAKDIMGGGRQAMYMASAVIMLRKSIDKDEKKKKKGSIIRMKSDKNRLARDEQQTEMYLSFTTGPNKYYGLIDDALESGVITKPSVGWYQTKYDENKFRERELYSSRIFTKELLEDLNEYCKKTYQYASVSYTEDTLAEDLEEQEVEED